MQIVKMVNLHCTDSIRATVPACTSSQPLWVSVAHEPVEKWKVTPAKLAAFESTLEDLGYNLENVTLVINDTVQIPENLVKIQVVSVNFFRLQTYYYKYFTTQEFCTEWHGGNRTLYLMGKPYAPHRLPLLKALIDRLPMEQLVYSFHSGKDTRVWKKNLCTFQDHFPDLNYAEFAHKYHNDLTGRRTITASDFHYSGFPFQVDLYTSTALSVISESHWQHHNALPNHYTAAWNTEKTWRAIANHHPFALISCEHLLVLLRSQGYLLWEQFFKHSPEKINQVTDIETRISMMVDNVEFFIKNQTPEIQVMAKHNADLMDQHAQQDINRVFGGDKTLFCRFMNHARIPNR